MERFEHGGDIYGNPGIYLDFSVNVNPLGMPDRVRQALISRVDEFVRYPDPQCRELRTAISRREGVPDDWILCGNGASDLISRLCYTLKPRRALICSPAFSEYERALIQVSCNVKHYILTEENQFLLTSGINEALTPDVNMIFLCNPNNPTGRLIPKKVIGRILDLAKENRTTVIMDECFLDFTDAGASCKEYLKEMPRLIVLKAFTKMYALAGLRLGYILSANIALLHKTSLAAGCWSVSVPAQIAGVTALSCDGWEEKTRRLIAKEKKFLTESLIGLGMAVFPSDANYLLLRCEKPLYDLLLKKGVLIRACENFIGLDAAYYRIGIKTRKENIRLIQTIKELF